EISISRYYVEPDEVDKRVDPNHKWLMAYRNITSVVSNERSVIVSIIPRVGVGNSAPVILSDFTDPLLKSCLYGNFCSLVFDYLAQQKIGGVNFNYFIFKQIPVLSPSIYKESIKQKIIPKILELTYTAWDIKSYADDIWINSNIEYRTLLKKQWEENENVTGGNKLPPPNWSELNDEGFPLPPFKWNDERRALLRSELDAIYAMLYGLTLNELIFILDPKSVYGDDFPGETFRVMKEKELKQYGEYRTKRLVLEAWEKMK
ncbi:MAG: type II DNA modification enzyme, partial [Bacteroidia bacterium]|nr:type II DNA modification enzyme [Bacteroidia bacterium]